MKLGAIIPEAEFTKQVLVDFGGSGETLNRIFQKANLNSVILQEPLQLAFQKPDGRWSNRPLLGEERFNVVGAYVGKKGQLLFKLKMIEDEFSLGVAGHYEVVGGTAMRCFTGFQGALSTAATVYEDEQLFDASKAGAIIEDKVHEKAILANHVTDERFGSW